MWRRSEARPSAISCSSTSCSSATAPAGSRSSASPATSSATRKTAPTMRSFPCSSTFVLAAASSPVS